LRHAAIECLSNPSSQQPCDPRPRSPREPTFPLSTLIGKSREIQASDLPYPKASPEIFSSPRSPETPRTRATPQSLKPPDLCSSTQTPARAQISPIDTHRQKPRNPSLRFALPESFARDLQLTPEAPKPHAPATPQSLNLPALYSLARTPARADISPIDTHRQKPGNPSLRFALRPTAHR
jgi:hypothetical protein